MHPRPDGWSEFGVLERIWPIYYIVEETLLATITLYGTLAVSLVTVLTHGECMVACVLDIFMCIFTRVVACPVEPIVIILQSDFAR